jgi:pimeloyl-ACP methyl ester carboxylesterase
VVRAGIPAAEFFPVDSAAHLPMLERSAPVHARLLEFLRAH